MAENLIIKPDLSQIAIWPYRSELTILPADKTKDKIGWSIFENIGIGVVNPHGVIHMSKCCLCQGHGSLSEVNINLKPCNDEDTYSICLKCTRKTRRMLKRLKKMDPRELPLFVSDPNIFIRTRATNLLQNQK
jgi:hypothetical protein